MSSKQISPRALLLFLVSVDLICQSDAVLSDVCRLGKPQTYIFRVWAC